MIHQQLIDILKSSDQNMTISEFIDSQVNEESKKEEERKTSIEVKNKELKGKIFACENNAKSIHYVRVVNVKNVHDSGRISMKAETIEIEENRMLSMTHNNWVWGYDNYTEISKDEFNISKEVLKEFYASSRKLLQ